MGVDAYYSLGTVQGWLDCDAEPEEIVQAMSERDFRVFGAVQPPGVLVPYHTHEEDEWLIVLEGCMKLIIEEEPVMLEVGEVISISANAVHGAVAVGDGPARVLIAFKN
ncbi:MAG: cupin domain-containing protein [Candidatus Tectomicrobia bacterium]|nr:cupin domain-containing protein [Candidatus Tectomicrobia bacterium]